MFPSITSSLPVFFVAATTVTTISFLTAPAVNVTVAVPGFAPVNNTNPT